MSERVARAKSPGLAGLRAELRPLFALAWPVIASELGWMAMGIVDTIMVGRLGAEAIGAVAIAGVLFFTVAVTGMGLLLGMDPMVAQAFGAGRFADCHRTLVQAVYVCLAVSPLIVLVLLGCVPWLGALGIQPSVLRLAVPYLKILSWCTLPLLLYSALRRYLQAIGLVKPIVVALVSANLVNLVGNWALIYGHFGLPALGVMGSAWATVLARLWLMLVVAVVLLVHARIHRTGLFRVSPALEPARLRRLLLLGMPVALQFTLEVAVFGAATALAGRFAPAALAAHQIVLNTASFTYMVPLGVSAAAAVRVGHAIGRRQPLAACQAGWTALVLGAGFMGIAGLVFLAAPGAIMRIYTDDPEVISAGRVLFFAAAMFQLFDGVQVVASGVLRGTGETRIPMLSNLVAYWVIGLPISYAVGVWGNHGVPGLWFGLVIALMVTAIVLLVAWMRKARALSQADALA